MHDTMIPGRVMIVSTLGLMICFHTHFINAWLLSKQQYTERSLHAHHQSMMALIFSLQTI